MRITLFFIIILLSCTPSKKEVPLEETVPADSTENRPAEVIEYDYTPLYGIYDHESTTKSFGGVVSIQQQGYDVYATISVVQGTCKSETEGVVVMADHTANFYIGFFQVEGCQLQFNFYPKEQRLDIQEIGVCRIHGPTCSFEGRYSKRKQF
jgi:hypothetical protein